MLGYRLLVFVCLEALLSLGGIEGGATPFDERTPRENAAAHRNPNEGEGGADGERLSAAPTPFQPTPPDPQPPTPPPPPTAGDSVAAGPLQRVSDGGRAGGTGEDGDDQCPARNEECSRECQWVSELGAVYSLQDFTDKVFQSTISNLKGSSFQFTLCLPSLNCNGQPSPTCLSVPGWKLTTTGRTVSVDPLEPNAPGQGFKLVLSEGDECEMTGRPRITIIHLPCNPNARYTAEQLKPSRASEGARENLCRYTVEFPASQFGCPVVSGGVRDGPQLTAVAGCTNSDPLFSTEDCHFAGHTHLTLHGLHFHLLCPEVTPPTDHARFPTGRCTSHVRTRYTVYVGTVLCRDVTVVSQFMLSCTLERGAGKNLDVVVYRNMEERVREGEGEGEREREVVMILKDVVSFKEIIDFREKFNRFAELGVGGLKKEIDELYRRAFASRGVSQEVLAKMGITHVKGILLYGPPGTGKTLIARTIATVLGSKQVQLINGPEIISKYLGESERNLRSHFEAAQKAWKEQGPLSELFVIIIDEIDAICKPRGKTDQSAAGVAYDALVNQLLTLMDGLQETYNTLVVGLTNRRELLDSALLRPGRFEVQIEVSLPDEEGRREIFEIHTRSMLATGMLADDVDMRSLAANTSRFSGAEIAGVVRAASSYALERYQSDTTEESVLVTALDFERAIYSVNPAYTHSETQVLSMFLPNGYLSCGESHDAVLDLTLDLLHMLKHSPSPNMQTLLLYGPRGSGKTTLAAQLAVLGKFSFVKVLTASSVVGQSTLHKMEVLHSAFSDAFSSFSSELSMILLDDLHRLVQYLRVGSQITVSHDLLHTVTTLLTSSVPAGVRLLVVGTLTVEEGVSLEEPDFLGLPALFLQHHHIPLLDTPAVHTFLQSSNIHKFGTGQFVLPSNLKISVRQLLHAMECACVQGSCSLHHSEPSVVKQDHLLDCIMAYVTRQMAELDTELE